MSTTWICRSAAPRRSAALAATHKIAPKRLRTAGVGFLAPVAANASEEGRALNRRVELVAP